MTRDVDDGVPFVGRVGVVGSVVVPVGLLDVVGVDFVVVGAIVDEETVVGPDELGTCDELEAEGFVVCVVPELPLVDETLVLGPTTDGDTVIGTNPELDGEAPGSDEHAPTARVPASTASNTRLDRPIPHAPRLPRHPATNPEQ